MGYSSYSSVSRTAYMASTAHKTRDEIFSKKVHQGMNPKNMTPREARDSEAHPNSFPIIIGLDVTGSMGYIPEYIVKEGLTDIVEGLITAGIPDPAICFVAIGDQFSDKAPIQIGQFESGDKELAMWLERTWLESGGGGGMEESYWLAWYFANNFTITDAWEKRNTKGVLITIGDEKTHVATDYIDNIFGGQPLSLPVKDVLKQVQEKWNVYHIHANDGSYNTRFQYGQNIVQDWQNLIGQSVRVVDEHKNIPKEIVEIVVGNYFAKEAGIDEVSKVTEENTTDNPSKPML